ncbi:MAG TPA: nuclear transport factor 2 family protein [Longimicrobium sp.]|nr:nuclear transport factor 2 family protein [Longimicrobium sp.]
MKRILLPLSFCLSMAACATAAAGRPAQAGIPDHAAVVAAANGLFDAMRARDTAAIRAMFLPSAPIVSIGRRQNGEAVVEAQGVGDFLPQIAAAPGTLDERMWDPEVRVDGDLATLWAPYDFHFGGEFSHCGVDTFQLVRVDGRWRIAALSYTGRREGCPPAPPR